MKKKWKNKLKNKEEAIEFLRSDLAETEIRSEDNSYRIEPFEEILPVLFCILVTVSLVALFFIVIFYFF